MALSATEVKRLMIAAGDTDLGNSIADAVNAGENLALQSSHTIALCKVATSVSQTVDFGALAVGDIVTIHPVALGTTMYVIVATAGTLGQAAVVGSLYIAHRARAVPAVPTEKF